MVFEKIFSEVRVTFVPLTLKKLPKVRRYENCVSAGPGEVFGIFQVWQVFFERDARRACLGAT